MTDRSTSVLVNLLWLVPGVVGGSEQSLTGALRSIAADPPTDLDLRLAVLRPFAEAHPDLAERFPLEVLPADGSDKVRRVLAEQSWLARVTRRSGAAVVHHAGGIVPVVHPGRVVLTVHDLQPLDLPRNFSRAKRSYISTMVGRSVRAAAVVCVPSEFTRQRVIDLLGADPASVVVVPWARSGPSAPSKVASGATAVPDGPYFLYPAITYPHKNHVVLLDALARIGRDLDVSLVLTGGDGAAEAQVAEQICSLGLEDRVVRTGRVGQDQLEALYAAATAVVVPSRYEGFGLPVLEAMDRGVPVLAAAAGSLPEVARSEDLVDPDDVTAWTDAMQAVLALSDHDRADRIAAGRELAARFTPQRTAAGTLDAYRTAARR